MRFTAQTDSLDLLKEALASRCQGVRYGAEFCEWKLPSPETLEEAWEESREAEKAFSFVTPVVSNTGIGKLRDHLARLEELGGAEVVVGDLGTLGMLQGRKGLRPRLGRSRVYIPARCPWPQITRMPNPSFLARRRVERIFYQTNLNYHRSLQYYKTIGVEGADADWIPKSFPHLQQIVRGGLRLAVHTHAIPVAVTERCHTARFLGEEQPALCSHPCSRKAYTIRQKELGSSFRLHGNVAYRLVQPPQPREVKELERMGVDELVLPMGPVLNLNNAGDLDEAIADLARA